MSRTHPTTYAATIENISRLGSSKNGNPRFLIEFTDGTSAPTEVDGSVGYEVDNYDRIKDGPFLVKAHRRSGHIWSMVPIPQPGDLVERKRDHPAAANVVHSVKGETLRLAVDGSVTLPLPVSEFRVVRRAGKR